MKVALTGATGFIGSHLLAALLRRGHEPTALVRSEAAAVVPGSAARARGIWQ